MKVLIIGGGGREYGLAWATSRSPRVSKILAAPGNAGIAKYAQCFSISLEAIESLVQLAQQQKPDLVLIGPEIPLTLGLADRLAAENIPAFGPSAKAARLEGSKAFAKAFMARHKIPTAGYRVCQNRTEAIAAVQEFGLPVVIKADGLAAGKGVTVAQTPEQAQAAIRAAMEERIFGSAGDRLVIEEYLSGEEVSILAFTDGKTIVPMVAAQDHKRIYDGDQGPNTGGMGAYAPAPVVTSELQQRIAQEILLPTISGMAAEGTLYQGVLYAGLMLTAAGPKVVEFNCRLGDPETQVVLPLLSSDLVTIAQACYAGQLTPQMIQWSSQAAVCVVMSAAGYPGPYTQGLPINGIEAAEAVPGVMVWHAGTAKQQSQLVTQGGRVLNVIAVAPTIAMAVEKVYTACAKISFTGAHYRRDIAYRALPRGAIKKD